MTGQGPGWITWAGLAVVLAAAAVLSFAALRDLAELCGVKAPLSWLLPICVDAGCAVSTRVWLSGRAVAAERYARNMTLALLAVTVAGNAVHGGLVAAGIRPAWWLAVVVGAVPAAVVGAAVHLAVLVSRPAREIRSDPEPISETPCDSQGVSTPEMDSVAGDPVAALLAAGAGRRRIARELAVSEYRAQQLVKAHRNGAGHE